MSAYVFQDYVDEYIAEGIGPLLYHLILDAVRQVVVRYPPSLYSPDRVWDEGAVRGICHDFILTRLIKAGWLSHHLMAQESVEGLKRVIRRDVKHFLINQKRRSEYTNIFTRLYHILREDTRFRAN